MAMGIVNVPGGGGSEEKLTNHLADKNNPHGVTAAQIGAAAANHTHTAGQISGLPTSLPASDVYEWAKQPEKPVYTALEVGALRLHGWQAATDFNALTESGIYQCQGVNLNTPYGSDIDTHFHVMVFLHSDQWIRQVAYDVRGQNCYTRAKTNNVWSSWQQIMLGSDVTSLLAGKQDASTAINTGNIGSQNVNYATYAALSNYDQDYGARLRNQALVAADTTPGANGQIFWTYG
ncbi:pyocin knob domain-containing protein [Colidextribacter sp. 210702-DFI.3.9]|nr:pyocin knob domain-containing protein [Colidextribacter sp. 210702-DFI.3.9]